MKNKSLIFLLVLISCASFEVKKDYDESYDFSQLNKYSLIANGKLSLEENSLIGQRVREAIDAELRNKGFEPTTSTDADFLITVEYWERQYIDSGNVSVGLGAGTFNQSMYGTWGLGYGVPRVREQDTLAIRMYNSKNNHEIWQGRAVGNIKNGKTKKNQEQFSKAVHRILEHFPPGYRPKNDL